MRRGQRTVQTETKYIELMVVNDYELVRVMLTALRLFSLSLIKIKTTSAGAPLLRPYNRRRVQMKASDTVLFLLVCAAASFSHSDEELCQSGGEHG